jgi:hypothetical protein
MIGTKKVWVTNFLKDNALFFRYLANLPWPYEIGDPKPSGECNVDMLKSIA